MAGFFEPGYDVVETTAFLFSGPRFLLCGNWFVFFFLPLRGVFANGGGLLAV